MKRAKRGYRPNNFGVLHDACVFEGAHHLVRGLLVVDHGVQMPRLERPVARNLAVLILGRVLPSLQRVGQLMDERRQVVVEPLRHLPLVTQDLLARPCDLLVPTTVRGDAQRVDLRYVVVDRCDVDDVVLDQPATDSATRSL